jgi:methylenetetrahydrofolate dehydrogenase (NADP+)/methenyltetrahydrofolate cyclohydrolase
MSHLMTRENATVILTHSKTQDLSQFTKQADILIVAAGKPALIHAEDIKPGAVVIDVGIHRIAGNKIIGDVDYISCSKVASAITPVPGGIGPLTVAMLFENTLTAAERNFRS